MIVSLLPSVKGDIIQRSELSWDQLTAACLNPTQFNSKAECPLIKLATFGDRYTEKGSLRHDANVMTICGVEGDYDGEVIQPADGAALLQWAGIKALIYTSPSHTRDKPRWRVLAPLSRDYEPRERRELIAQVNGALGGVLANESFTLSQTYYIGRIVGVDYEVYPVEGQYLDLVHNLAPIYPVRETKTIVPAEYDERVVTDEVIEELRGALKYISTDEYGERIAVGQALAGLGEVGYQLWEEWLDSAGREFRHPTHIKWNTFTGSRTGFQSVFAKAQRAGWVNPKKGRPINLDGVFTGGADYIEQIKQLAANEPTKAARLAGNYIKAGLVDEATVTDLLLELSDNREAIYSEIAQGMNEAVSAVPYDPDWKVRLEAHVAKWNEKHASVIIGGHHRIMREMPPDINHENRVTYEFIKRPDLLLLYDHTIIQTGEKELQKKLVPVFSNHALAWAKHKNARTYTGGIVFLPGREAPADYFNTWRGFAVEPKQDSEAAARIYRHIAHVVCNGDQAIFDYVIRWIAYTIQFPDKPAGAAIVMRGEKGCGKGLIGHFLRRLWGNHGLHLTNPKHLVGQFNGHLTDVCLLFADEAFYSGDKSHENILKGIITEPTQLTERKGIDPQQQPNYLKVIMATNSDFAIRASADERRYCVIDVSSQYIKNRDYFNPLLADTKNEHVQAAFLYDMLTVDLTGFHTGDIPETAGLRSQRFYSMGSIQRWLGQALIDGSFNANNFGPRIWQEEMTSDDLFNSYVEFCNINKIGEYGRASKISLCRYLAKLYVARRIGHAQARGYFLGTLENSLENFERLEKINLSEV